jgi:hypothetical protein
MLRRYLRFIRAVSVNPLGRWGVVLTTSSFFCFVIMELAQLTGIVTNAYVGLIVYLVFPALFIIGLVLIPIGWRRRLKQTGLSSKELLESQFGGEEVKGGLLGAPVFKTVALLTLGNVVFLGAASMQMLHFMDSAHFCGTACHSVMSPEWTTYQQSPHARVACVDCHVGEGFGALLNSKLNGAYQILSVTLNLYERPIPTPVHQLRPARETCEKCHWPDKFYGNRLVTHVQYQSDEKSTARYTTLNIKIDAGPAGATGVHWHIGEANEVRYASVGDERQEMIWVDVRRPDGTFHRYENTNPAVSSAEAGEERSMDCVDCHNRATHIYQDPGRAVDEMVQLGRIDRSLPYIRREALASISGSYSSREQAMEGIRAHLQGFYERKYQQEVEGWQDAIDSAADALQGVYARNVHHVMRIRWGAYPSMLGHSESPGCFRCHTPDLKDENGKWISDDCTLCHSILANDEMEPFKYLRPPEDDERARAMHEYLREEFLSSFFPATDNVIERR